jgi:Cu/Ag efflux protein CusF
VHQGSTPRTVEGQVVKIDMRAQRVTIRTSDGKMHEFQASKETLQDLKEGDRIEARLRQ